MYLYMYVCISIAPGKYLERERILNNLFVCGCPYLSKLWSNNKFRGHTCVLFLCVCFTLNA